MLRRLGVNSFISNKKIDILNADKLILPGVGSFDYGMEQLENSGLIDVLNKKVIQDKTPILGICLGLQLLTSGSEEGKSKGLGWIKAKTVSFNKLKLSTNEKIPHMGWCNVKEYENSNLFANMSDEPRFYFVHSFHLEVEDESDVLVKANYGYDFVAGVEKENILGVQFHPEKSHKFGMQLLKNFVNYY